MRFEIWVEQANADHFDLNADDEVEARRLAQELWCMRNHYPDMKIEKKEE